MGLVISKGLTLRKGYIGTDDPDAEAYIAAVEAADLAADPTAEPLETATKVAIHSFVKGAKADGFWPAIKASCILAGARTRLGALTPLVGTAPTSFNFVDGDYNRKTGLVGNGSTKFLDSNRAGNADPQNSRHLSVFATSLETGRSNPAFIGNASSTFNGRSFLTSANNTTPRTIQSSCGNSGATTSPNLGLNLQPGLVGASRSQSASYQVRFNLTNQTISQASETISLGATWVFARPNGAPDNHSAHRLAFYSIGESLNLALLDARVTDLINAFGAAIP
jgi:hypothetical protein